MTASGASSKAKAKFSSRNLSAVYKAPALRGVELGGNGVSSSGLNRMLVLKAPVRGGVQATNAVAAPTPINTPSLRKENNGQDVNVSLVPAGKSGGWGVGNDGSVEREEANAAHAEMQHSAGLEPQRPTYHARAANANAWSSGAGALSRTSSSSSGGGGASVMPVGRGGSGRWGDDAVEEDFAQSEMYRQMERKREFPELPDHHNQHEPVLMHSHRHNHPQQYPGYSQNTRAQHPNSSYHRESQYAYGSRVEAEHATTNGYPEMPYHQRPQQHYMERGYYHNNQDARHENVRRDEPRAAYDRHYGGDRRIDSTRHEGYRNEPPYNYDSRDQGRGFEDYYQARQAYGGYGPRYYREFPNQSPHESNGPPRAKMMETNVMPVQQPQKETIACEDNQAECSDSERTDSRPNSASAWKTTSPTQRSSSETSSVWKMSESEVGSSKHVPEYQRALGNAQSYPRQIARPSHEGIPTQQSTSVSAVNQIRILKRNGPRMLFDPKSGTMVEVEESASCRRSNTSSPAPRDSSSVRSDGSNTKSTEPSMIQTKDVEVAGLRESTETAQVSVTTAAESLVQSNSPEMCKLVGGSHEEEVQASSFSSRKTRPRSKESEPKKKRLAIGGKMKKVVVAYRPVVVNAQPLAEDKSEEARQLKSTGVDATQTNNSRKRDIEPPKRRKTRDAAVKKGENSSGVSAKSTKLEKSDHVPERRTGKVTKDAVHTKSARKANFDRPTPKRVVEHTQTNVNPGFPIKSNVVSLFDQLKVFSAGDGVVFVDEDHATQGFVDDDDAPFTTVKSRRTILLERKRQREQFVAALSGFHERGGVKRAGSRVVLPGSLQRFGKKGLLVGFRSTVKDDGALSAVPPPLEKPFIDVIRPPAPVSEVKEQITETTDEGPGAKKKHKLKKKETQQTSKPRASPSPDTDSNCEKSTHQIKPTEAEAVSAERNKESVISTQPVQATVSTPLTVPVSTIPREEAKSPQVLERSESFQQRERRGSGPKKGVKKIYVVKQATPSPVVKEGSNEPFQPAPVIVELLPPAPTHVAHIPAETVPVVKEVEVKRTPVSEEKRAPGSQSERFVVKTRDRKLKPKPRKSSVSSKDVANVGAKKEKHITAKPTLGDERQKNPKLKPVVKGSKAVKAATAAKDGKDVAKPTTEVVGAIVKVVETPRVVKAVETPNVVKAAETPKAVKVVETPKADPPAAPRRPSRAKSLEVPKSTASTSTKKIYKKVYVVKTASTTDMSSPSAA